MEDGWEVFGACLADSAGGLLMVANGLTGGGRPEGSLEGLICTDEALRSVEGEPLEPRLCDEGCECLAQVGSY